MNGVYQNFLLDTRDRVAKRFREQCNSADGEKANVYPYFIGVFDTVAALGSPIKSLIFTVLFAAAAVIMSFVVSYVSISLAPVMGHFLSYLTFPIVFGGIVGAVVAIGIFVFVYTHIKFDFRVPGYSWWQQLLTFHHTAIWQWFYDIRINENVGYAKHAISIDENRKDFARVAWGYKNDDHKHADSNRDTGGNIWFEQVWFAGNHSNIGGSYPENESRLSDISLDWMFKCASIIPDGLHAAKKKSGRLIAMHPAASGHATAAPPRRVMNSRRCMSDPKVTRRHLTGSNEYFDRGLKPASKPLPQCTADVAYGSRLCGNSYIGEM